MIRLFFILFLIVCGTLSALTEAERRRLALEACLFSLDPTAKAVWKTRDSDEVTGLTLFKVEATKPLVTQGHRLFHSGHGDVALQELRERQANPFDTFFGLITPQPFPYIWTAPSVKYEAREVAEYWSFVTRAEREVRSPSSVRVHVMLAVLRGEMQFLTQLSKRIDSYTRGKEIETQRLALLYESFVYHFLDLWHYNFFQISMKPDEQQRFEALLTEGVTRWLQLKGEDIVVKKVQFPLMARATTAIVLRSNPNTRLGRAVIEVMKRRGEEEFEVVFFAAQLVRLDLPRIYQARHTLALSLTKLLLIERDPTRIQNLQAGMRYTKKMAALLPSVFHLTFINSDGLNSVGPGGQLSEMLWNILSLQTFLPDLRCAATSVRRKDVLFTAAYFAENVLNALEAARVNLQNSYLIFHNAFAGGTLAQMEVERVTDQYGSSQAFVIREPSNPKAIRFYVGISAENEEALIQARYFGLAPPLGSGLKARGLAAPLVGHPYEDLEEKIIPRLELAFRGPAPHKVDLESRELLLLLTRALKRQTELSWVIVDRLDRALRDFRDEALETLRTDDTARYEALIKVIEELEEYPVDKLTLREVAARFSGEVAVPDPEGGTHPTLTLLSNSLRDASGDARARVLEQISMNAVQNDLERRGLRWRDVSKDNWGYDLLVGRANQPFYVEVKSAFLGNTTPTFYMTRNELEMALNSSQRSNWVLALVLVHTNGDASVYYRPTTSALGGPLQSEAGREFHVYDFLVRSSAAVPMLSLPGK